MKKMMKFWVSGMIALVIQSHASLAQKIDEERMTKDIEVAESALATLIKQEINQQRHFFGLDIKGSYQPGYGVTFRLPGDYATSMAFTIPQGADRIIYSDQLSPVITYSRTEAEQDAREENEKVRQKEAVAAYKLKEKSAEKRRITSDSLRDEYNKKVIKASKDFIIDYGDFISQLGPNEKIIVTNQGENRSWYFKENKRTHISVEALKSDITAFRQGKLTRDQALSKLKVVNTESVDVKEPDMELLASIFNRLYRQDLSKTYFTENSNIYYERLKDYGVIFYMQVFSSYQGEYKKYNMPTVGLEDLDEETKNKKIVELYPKFEQDVKDNLVEYGRTLKTLKDEEVLVFNITMTKCKGCGIPSTLELSIKGSVLKDFGAGKIDKNTAVSKFTVKKGANQ